MKTASPTPTSTMTFSLADVYMNILASLSVDEKLDLICKLTDSIRHRPKTAKTAKEDFYANIQGDWNDI